jgi:serine/threonine-protein kinase
MPNRYELVNSIVEEALDLGLGEQKAFISRSCGTDKDLLERVNRLLAMSGDADGFADPPATFLELRAGDLLGDRFRIIEELGAGGMGSIYLAEDRELGEVALKVLHPEMRGEPCAMASVRSEIRAARTVRHPNVCAAYDLFSFDHPRAGAIVAVTMQYVRGESLACRITNGPLASNEILGIARGLASGIDALHAEGIIHGDLKPGNVMLTTARDGAVKPVLIDFGLAGFSDSKPAAEKISGTASYMAPERFRGGIGSKAADIYAFGVMLFEMTTGSRPFPQEDLLPSVIRRVTEDAPRLPQIAPSAPQAWEHAISQALSREPGRRPPTAGAVVRAMEVTPPSEVASVRPRSHCMHRGNRFVMSRRQR